MRIAGVVSGTSLDGVTIVVADVSQSRWKVVEVFEAAYRQALRKRLLAISNATAHTSEVSRLNFALGEEWAAALRRLQSGVEKLDAVALSGQTIFHERGATPSQAGTTLQIGEATVVAERTGKRVVSNFRTRDVAAGGQGAPLVPFADYRIFRSRTRNRVALNIGGIANITCLPKNCAPEQVVGFDTGPGNMILDQLAQLATGGKLAYDKDARIARQGQVLKPLLAKLQRAPYFRQKPPKTCGREQYGEAFVAEFVATGHSLPDLMATATAFTAATIAEGIVRFCPVVVDEVLVAGGGARNPMLMDQLRGFLPKASVLPSDAFGVPAEAREGLAFAIIAWETLQGRPGNLPRVTGAKHPVVLGQITPA